jgi:hypothetical protein
VSDPVAGSSRPGQRELPRSSLRSRLAAIFAAGAVLLALIVGISALSFVHLIDSRHSLLNQVDPASLASDQLLVAYLDQETGIRGYILGHNPTYLVPTVQGLVAQKAETAKLQRDLVDYPAIALLVQRARTAATRWQVVFAQPAVVSTAAGSTLYASDAALAKSKQLFDAVRHRFTLLNHALVGARVQAGDNLDSATTQLIIVVGAGIGLVIVAGFALQLALRRWVTRPLARLGDDSRLVAGGELSRPITPGGPLEIHALSHDIEAMRDRIVRELTAVTAARADLDRRNEDLGRSNRELEQFAYVASHDLQEPLRKVTSFVQLLEQRYAGQLDDRADQYIGFAVDGATRMQLLINDLLDFSRVGRTTEGFADLPMGACVASAIEHLDTAIRESGAQVTVNELPHVVGDQVLLTSVWQNLIGNAIKFRGSEPPQILIDSSSDGRFHQFRISDNGIGIEQRFAEKVFVIFQRLHGRDAYDGTGIGLALCRKIVDFHGGRIWLDTTVTSGTRICFTLPDQTHQGGGRV